MRIMLCWMHNITELDSYNLKELCDIGVNYHNDDPSSVASCPWD